MFRNCFHRFQTVFAFRDHFDFFVYAEQFAQHLPRQLFVIHDDGAQILRLSLVHFASPYLTLPDFAVPVSAAVFPARASCADPASGGADSAAATSPATPIATHNLSSPPSPRTAP